MNIRFSSNAVSSDVFETVRLSAFTVTMIAPKNIILNIDNLIRFCGNNDQYLTDSEKELLNLIKNNLKSPKKNSVETLTKLKKELFCWK